LQEELISKAGVAEKRLGEPSVPAEEVVAEVARIIEGELTEARKIPGKADRSNAIDTLRTKLLDENFKVPEGIPYSEHQAAEKRRRDAKEAFRRLEKKITQKLINESGVRADGRKAKEIRPLKMKVKMLPRTHGSALFQRGETQSIVTCVLGTGRDEQIVDGLMPEYAKKFYLHYNFPPFCVGEAGRIMGPGRREIGHGALAERSLMAVLPDIEEFPYTVRLISDITESNGSSSMASVCGGCLAMMDAGVPIKATVAGISVGRFSDDSGKMVHVTDIIGEEDFFGDMDFKVSGTRDGITGIQLDLKARGLQTDEIKDIFERARGARIELIDAMEGIIPAPREELSEFAPRIITVLIDPEKIGKLIGPGGKTIRSIQERTGATIDVENDGRVFIAATNGEAGERAKAEVEALGAEVKVGAIYEGTVVSTKDFGAFIEIATGTDGMCHISELADGFVKSVEDIVKIGDVVKVKVINVDDNGRIKLSRRAAMIEAGEIAPSGDGDSDGDGDSRRRDDDDGDGDGDGRSGGGRRRRRRKKPAAAAE
ncbi:MAG: polyribonucleotide nucleotidyltransferase, partial [Phycisphaerales bacterium]|nr:polyribonucleotide nucleotidyltransferase [Phycisphaerales bacterium]